MKVSHPFVMIKHFTIVTMCGADRVGFRFLQEPILRGKDPYTTAKTRSLMYAMETAVHSYFIYVSSYSASVVRTTTDLKSSLSVRLISPH